jgi:tetratricopeptide (TPR) repeat protein
MLHTIRDFAVKWLAEQPELGALVTDALISWAGEWSRQRKNTSYDEVRGEIQVETPNLLAALARIHDLGRPELPVVMRALFSGSPTPIQELVDIARLVDAAVSSGLEVPLATRETTLDVLGGMGVVTDAAQSIEAMRSLVEEADTGGHATDVRIRTRLTVIRAVPLPAEEALARQLLDEALNLAGDRPEHRSVRSGLLTMYGVVEHLAGNFATAIDRYELAIAECIAVNNHTTAATNMVNQAEALLDLGGDPERALAATQRGLQYSEQGSPMAHVAELLAGEAYAELGLTGEALDVIGRNRADLETLRPVDPSLDFYIDRATEKLAALAAAGSRASEARNGH